MRRRLVLFLIILIPGLIAGCAYLQKEDIPPPLPPIEEPKPPLSMKSDYYKSYPWSSLSKPRKDTSEPDTTTYSVKEGDTLEKITENVMGNASLAPDLAKYNDLLPTSKISTGDKLVVPNPIIGVSGQMWVKGKKDKDFAQAKAFDVELGPGDQYKMKFESNVDGYLYVLRQDPKGTDFLYPARVKVAPKRGKKSKNVEPLPLATAKIEAYRPIDIPLGPQGFKYDAKKKGDRILVFLSLRQIPDLEDLRETSSKEKKKTKQDDVVEDVMLRVKQGEVFAQPPYHLLRISDPNEVLGFTLNING